MSSNIQFQTSFLCTFHIMTSAPEKTLSSHMYNLFNVLNSSSNVFRIDPALSIPYTKDRPVTFTVSMEEVYSYGKRQYPAYHHRPAAL